MGDIKLEKYLKVRNGMDTFDKLEFRSHSLLGKAIRWKTGDWSNHTGIVIRFHEYDAAGVFTIESLENGVKPKRLSLRLEEFNGSVRLYKLKPEFHHLRKSLGEASLSLEGTRYDFWSIPRNLYRRVPINKSRLFCSEFVTAAGIDGGLPKPEHNYAPHPGKDMDALGWWIKDYITIL